MTTSLYLYQNSRAFSQPPQPPCTQHHVVIADADTGKHYTVHSCTPDPFHDPVSEYKIGEIADKASAIYLELGTIGRRPTEDIAAEIMTRGLSVRQAKNLQMAFREMYKEELTLPSRPAPLERMRKESPALTATRT